jgi:hypothetical protein
VLYGIRAIELGVCAEAADPFSYTVPGAKWVNHEWLTEWQLGWLWMHAGQTGLILWRNLWVLLVWLVAGWSVTRTDCRLGAGVLMLALVAECLSDFVVFVRPQLATFGFFAVYLALLRRHWDAPASRTIWLSPVFMVVWVNMHGGFLAGLGIQAAFLFAGLFRLSQPQGRRRIVGLFGVFLASLLATFVNPYGWQMHAMLWQHLGTEQFVREWQPLWATRQSLIYYVPFLLMGLGWLGRRKSRSIDWIILAIVSWQAVLHLRHVALLAIAVLVLLPAALSDGCDRLFPQIISRWSAHSKRPLRFAAIGLIMAFFAYLDVRATSELRADGIGFGQIAVETRSHVPGMPLNAIAVIRREGLAGNLITDYGWGQCVIWHLFPESRVAFDGRYRTVYPPRLEREFLDWNRADEVHTRTAMLDDYATEIALVPAGSNPDRCLAARPDWREIFRDDQAVLFVSQESARFHGVIQRAEAGRVRSPNLPRWVQFPGS